MKQFSLVYGPLYGSQCLVLWPRNWTQIWLSLNYILYIHTYIYTIWYVSVCGSVSVSTAFRKRSQSPPTVCCRRVCLIANCITLNIHKHNEYTHVRVCQNRHKQLPLNPGESGSTNVPQNGNGNGLRCNLRDWQKFWLFCSV